ncbi:hypothetical protein IE53DRAFT_387440 [Violaceomyces palustris]|uniref:Uncharacterized protein n=1 Tax=Violaceomyces palustris TaxID=1673888 RepID=A0ACD0NX06_9BASI|nr:hypothetical protein IE53DRAFT_387440 [Violaceomyces palustris]
MLDTPDPLKQQPSTSNPTRPKPDSRLTINVSLHPLSILNVSEHYVRSRCQSGRDDVKVYGVLLGTQSAQDITVQNSFEIQVDLVPLEGGKEVESERANLKRSLVDLDFLTNRQSLYKQVFPTLDIVGWYSVGSVPDSEDVEIHKQLLEVNESPIMMQLRPTNTALEEAEKAGELPINVYESVVELVKGETKTFFLETRYRIETGEAERIAVDHTSQAVAGTSEESSLIGHLKAHLSAIIKLHERILLIKDYVQDVRKGLAPRQDDCLRQIHSLISTLPASNIFEFQQEFLKEYNDVLLTTYLSNLTTNLQSLNELIDKFDLVQSSNGNGVDSDLASGGGGTSRVSRGRAAPIRS